MPCIIMNQGILSNFLASKTSTAANMPILKKIIVFLESFFGIAFPKLCHANTPNNSPPNKKAIPTPLPPFFFILSYIIPYKWFLHIYVVSNFLDLN